MSKKGREKVESELRSTVIRWIPVTELKIDQDAQRGLNNAWVAAEAKEFDPEKLGLIVINKRKDGLMYIVDGQHRVAIILFLGWDDQSVPCEYFEGRTQQQEAGLFLSRNNRRSVRPYDRFRVRVTAKEPIACRIYTIVASFGLAVSNYGDGVARVTAVSAMERVYRGEGISKTDGPNALKEALTIIIESWGKESKSFAGIIIEGIGLAKLKYGKELNNNNLVKRLAKFTGGAAGLIGKARSSQEIHGQSIPRNCAAVIVDHYNRGKSVGKLEIWWS